MPCLHCVWTHISDLHSIITEKGAAVPQSVLQSCNPEAAGKVASGRAWGVKQLPNCYRRAAERKTTMYLWNHCNSLSNCTVSHSSIKSFYVWLHTLLCSDYSLNTNWSNDICGLMSSSEIRTVKELPPGKVSHVQSSPLWKPILRHGLFEKREANQTTVQNLVFTEVFLIWMLKQIRFWPLYLFVYLELFI